MCHVSLKPRYASSGKTESFKGTTLPSLGFGGVAINITGQNEHGTDHGLLRHLHHLPRHQIDTMSYSPGKNGASRLIPEQNASTGSESFTQSY